MAGFDPSERGMFTFGFEMYTVDAMNRERIHSITGGDLVTVDQVNSIVYPNGSVVLFDREGIVEAVKPFDTDSPYGSVPLSLPRSVTGIARADNALAFIIGNQTEIMGVRIIKDEGVDGVFHCAPAALGVALRTRINLPNLRRQ